jgi:hypothetical protein
MKRWVGSLLILAVSLAFFLFVNATATDAKNKIELDGLGAPIEVESFQWGIVNTTPTSSGMGAGHRQAQEAKFRYVPQHGDAVAEWARRGAAHTVKVIESGPNGPLTITLFNAMVNSWQMTSNSSGGDRPMVSVSLNFTKMEEQYTSQTDAAKGGWDLQLNRPAPTTIKP